MLTELRRQAANCGRWKEVLYRELDKPYFRQLASILETYYGDECYCVNPPKEEIFEVFRLCPLNKFKVCIMGQEPYPEKGVAHGLAFSVSDRKPGYVAPLLKMIFAELKNNYNTSPLVMQNYSMSSNLTSWATQGVLLLNSSLTFCTGADFSGWKTFTHNIIEYLYEEYPHSIYISWGNYTHSILDPLFAVDTNDKRDRNRGKTSVLLKAGHPSPMNTRAYGRARFKGNCHFIKANMYLRQLHKEEINWLSIMDPDLKDAR